MTQPLIIVLIFFSKLSKVKERFQNINVTLAVGLVLGFLGGARPFYEPTNLCFVMFIHCHTPPIFYISFFKWSWSFHLSLV